MDLVFRVDIIPHIFFFTNLFHWYGFSIVSGMKILDLKTFRGPNYWSVRHKKLVELSIDPGKFRDLTNSKFIDFSKKLKEVLPSLDNSSQEFFNKVEQGISIEEIILYIAIKLQLRAGMDCSFSKTYSDSDKSYVIFSYVVERAGVFAGETAFRIVESLARDENYDEIQNDIDELIYLKQRYTLGPTADYLLDEIKKRGIPYRQFNSGSLMALGHGNRQKKIRTAITDNTSGLGMELASDKEETKELLSEAHIPIPRGILVISEDELRERINEVMFPIVTKPLDGNHGRGVTTDINSVDKAVFGFNNAKKISREVIVEEFIKGDDYRLLVINNELVAATLRTPAKVIGDGRSTINQLIEKENCNPQRGEGAEYVLAIIKIDDHTKKILSDKKLTLESILPENQTLFLKDTANISMGGTATDVTDIIHPENKFMAERIARIFNLDICGIDLVASRIDQPIKRGTGAVIEVNAGPGLRMHSNPQKGIPRNVAEKIVDMLFSDTEKAHIPITAIAEFKGANILTRLISHLAKTTGFKPGCNTSEGIYIQEHLTYPGNCTNFENEQEVLFDPNIDFAVLQCSDKSISESGFGFAHCNIAIITTVLEANESTVLRDRVELMETLIRTVTTNGYVIMNADDYSTHDLFPKVKCNMALFSRDKNNEKIKQHRLTGGTGALLDNNEIILFKGEEILTVIKLKNIFSETNDNNTEIAFKYICPAVLTAMVLGFNIHAIQKGLISFSGFPMEKRVNIFVGEKTSRREYT